MLYEYIIFNLWLWENQNDSYLGITRYRYAFFAYYLLLYVICTEKTNNGNQAKAVGKLGGEGPKPKGAI